MMMRDLLDPLHHISPIRCISANCLFGPRKYAGSCRNTSNLFNALVGRVPTWSVPARRLGALNEEPP